MNIARIVILLLAYLIFEFLRWAYIDLKQLSSIENNIISSYFAIIIIGTISMPLFFWSESGRRLFEKSKKLISILYNFMALFSLHLGVAFVLTILKVANSYFILFQFESWMAWLALAFSFFLFTLGLQTVKSGPQIENVQIKELTAKKVKFIQLSDLHISHFVPFEFIQNVIEQIETIKPDAIFLTGDIIDGNTKDLNEKISLLSRLSKLSPVYFCFGNHEYYWNYNEIKEALLKNNIIVLENEGRSIRFNQHDFYIYGVTDPAAKMWKLASPDFNVKELNLIENDYKILLSHQPGIAKKANQFGFDLQLSGHTHSGQFFPWNLVIGLAHKYYRGLYQVGKMSLYVNQGTAYWGPSLRHGTFCEITLLN